MRATIESRKEPVYDRSLSMPALSAAELITRTFGTLMAYAAVRGELPYMLRGEPPLKYQETSDGWETTSSGLIVFAKMGGTLHRDLSIHRSFNPSAGAGITRKRLWQCSVTEDAALGQDRTCPTRRTTSIAVDQEGAVSLHRARDTMRDRIYYDRSLESADLPAGSPQEAKALKYMRAVLGRTAVEMPSAHQEYMETLGCDWTEFTFSAKASPAADLAIGHLIDGHQPVLF